MTFVFKPREHQKGLFESSFGLLPNQAEPIEPSRSNQASLSLTPSGPVFQATVYFRSDSESVPHQPGTLRHGTVAQRLHSKTKLGID